MIAAAVKARPGRALRGTALLLALVTLAACGAKTPTLPKLGTDAVVLAFGDSLTFGTGATDGQSYPAVLERLIGRKVEGAGVPGEVTAAGLARLPSALDVHKPQLLILCSGGNDFLRKLGPQQAAANIRAMVRVARDRGVAVMLIAVPEPGLFPSPPDFYKDIAAETGLPYEGDALAKILRDNELKSDLIHPNAKGYARLAEAVAEVLRRSGAI
jgi:acyl-CoA thioesterase-1